MPLSLLKTEKTCTLQELDNIMTVDNGEEFVPLSKNGVGITLYNKDLPLSTGNELYARSGAVERLLCVQDELPKGYKLDVCYGYRSAAVQEEKFRAVLTQKVLQEARFASYKDEKTLRREWLDAVHSVIAAPEVAGHPSGGAVDVRLRDAYNRVVDMGTQMHDIVSPLTPFYPSHYYDFTPEFQKNRLILREAMCSAGFAPFNGEWWHFSYGDREWAALSNAPHALYNQVHFDQETGDTRPYNAMSSADILDEILIKNPVFKPL